MKKKLKIGFILGGGFVLLFAIWTVLILCVDVQPVGQNGTNIGFASLNTEFHHWTGVHLSIYTITDWLGLVPILVCIGFGILGLIQLIKRKNPKKVDTDLILLGFYYILVILAYLLFEMIPINYRPIPIDGKMEASYPSSTTLLVLSVMPTLIFEINRRVQKPLIQNLTIVGASLFSAFMVIGRIVAGVHWITDIVGAILLSTGLYLIFRSAVLFADGKRQNQPAE